MNNASGKVFRPAGRTNVVGDFQSPESELKFFSSSSSPGRASERMTTALTETPSRKSAHTKTSGDRIPRQAARPHGMKPGLTHWPVQYRFKRNPGKTDQIRNQSSSIPEDTRISGSLIRKFQTAPGESHRPDLPDTVWLISETGRHAAVVCEIRNVVADFSRSAANAVEAQARAMAAEYRMTLPNENKLEAEVQKTRRLLEARPDPSRRARR